MQPTRESSPSIEDLPFLCQLEIVKKMAPSISAFQSLQHVLQIALPIPMTESTEIVSWSELNGTTFTEKLSHLELFEHVQTLIIDFNWTIDESFVNHIINHVETIRNHRIFQSIQSLILSYEHWSPTTDNLFFSFWTKTIPTQLRVLEIIDKFQEIEFPFCLLDNLEELTLKCSFNIQFINKLNYPEKLKHLDLYVDNRYIENHCMDRFGNLNIKGMQWENLNRLTFLSIRCQHEMFDEFFIAREDEEEIKRASSISHNPLSFHYLSSLKTLILKHYNTQAINTLPHHCLEKLDVEHNFQFLPRSGMSAIDESTLSDLSNLLKNQKKLTSITLSGVKFESCILNTLPDLKCVELGMAVSPNIIKNFFQLPVQLESLSLYCHYQHFWNIEMEKLVESLPNLKDLRGLMKTCRHYPGKQSMLWKILDCHKQIEILDVSWFSIRMSVSTMATKFPQLRELYGIDAFAWKENDRNQSLSHVEKIMMHAPCRPFAKNLICIGPLTPDRFPRLRKWSIVNNKYNNWQFLHLFTGLTHLELVDFDEIDLKVSVLKHMKQLQVLILVDTNEDILNHIHPSSLTSLRYVNIHRSSINRPTIGTCRIIQIIQSMKHLQYLSLSGMYWHELFCGFPGYEGWDKECAYERLLFPWVLQFSCGNGDPFWSYPRSYKHLTWMDDDFFSHGHEFILD